MQSIAEENNLAETAFYVREAAGYRIRWFTPAVEVDLCGHATLAAAAVVLADGGQEVEFASRGGPLRVTREGGRYTLDFPRQPPSVAPPPEGLFAALGAEPREYRAANYCLCVYDTEAQVHVLQPDMRALRDVACFGAIATAPGEDCDFVSGFFAPAAGIDEDPVTGSAHCILTPYWAERLRKRALFARQISKRGGELWCEDRATRVGISGRVVHYMQGTISV